MSQATDIYLIESLWPDLKVKRQLGSGLFGSVYEVRTEGRDDSDRFAIRVLTLPRSLAAGKELARDLNLSQPQDLAAYYKDLVQGVQEEICQLQDLQFDSPFLKILDYKALKQLQGPGWHVLIRTEFLPSLSAYKPLEETLYALQASDPSRQADLEESASSLEAFSPNQALALSRDISQALTALHAHNLAYGPLLPSRIFRQGTFDYKLGGLPLSGLTGSLLARTGVGAWPVPVKVYLAPELADGYPASPASDIFSLGLLLLQLLSPQDFEVYLRTKISDLSENKEAQAHPLSMPHLQAALPDFAEVLSKATAPDPKDRYASLEDFQEDLQSLGQSLEDYLDAPEDLQDPATSLPEERDLVSHPLEEQDLVSQASEDWDLVGRPQEDRDLVSQFSEARDLFGQPSKDLADQDEEGEEAYVALGPTVQGQPLDQDMPSAYPEAPYQQVREEDGGDGYSPADFERLAVGAEPGEASEAFDPVTEAVHKRGQAYPNRPEASSSAPRTSTHSVASSSSEPISARELSHKEKTPGQRRWLLSLLITLSVAALAALLYFGYLFLQDKQPESLKPQGSVEESDHAEDSPSAPDPLANADPAQASKTTANETPAPAASKDTSTSETTASETPAPVASKDTPTSEITASETPVPAASKDAPTNTPTEASTKLQAIMTEQADKGTQEGSDQKASPATDSQNQVQAEEALASLDQVTGALTKPLKQIQSIRSQLQAQIVKSWQAFRMPQPEKRTGEKAAKEETPKEETVKPEESAEEKPEVGAEKSTEKMQEPTASEATSEPSATEGATQAADPQPSQQPAGTTYVVQNGDILYTILYKHYGAYEAVVDRVLAVNPQIENINNLPTGLEIFLPDLD